jgi:hypothetical protein
MSGAPDTDKAAIEGLARSFLDLWQDQLAAVAGDADLAETLNRMFAAWNLGAVAHMPGGWAKRGQTRNGADGAANETGQQRGRNSAASATSSPAGSAASATPSGGGGGELDQLKRRIAVLESRLAALETGAARGRRGAPAKPRKR